MGPSEFNCISSQVPPADRRKASHITRESVTAKKSPTKGSSSEKRKRG